jgi:4-aminobutyrate aminotransferase-like enzyme
MQDHEPRSNADWLALDRQYRIDHRYTAPIVLERGHGVRIWDVEGREYLDFESGQVCVSTGHCHAKLVDALAEQARTLMQTGSGYTDVPQILLAKKLAEITPGRLQKCYFAATGSEANEAALRIARLYTGRTEVAALMRGYHGMTHGSLSVTGFGGFLRNVPGSGVPGVAFLPTPYAYRCPYKGCDGACNLTCVQQAAEVLDWTTSGRPAAIILEVILSAGGMIVPSVAYLQAIRRLCDERGALMIVDEAQTGIGRTGRWFGVEHFGVVPDIITMSKSLGGGVPLSAVITTAEIADTVSARGYYQSSSHTGDPLLAAVGLANIRIIEEEGLLENAAAQGAYLKARLEDLRDRYEIVGDVRGIGLMLGIEIVADKTTRARAGDLATAISQYALEHGLLLGHRPSGAVSGNIIRILPPLTITRAEIDAALAILERAVQHAMATRGPARGGP